MLYWVLLAIIGALFVSCALILLLLLEAQHRHRRIERLLTRMDWRGEVQMASNTRIEAALGRINTATNNIAEDIRRVKEQLAGAGVDEAQLTALEDAATKLEGIAASTEDPVPGDGGGPVDPEQPSEG